MMTSDLPPLRVSALSKRFGERVILSHYELVVARAELVILAGSNGAGKSTLLGCIAGVIDPDEGRVCIAGHDLHDAPLSARANLRYLAQEVEAPRGLTGRELLVFYAEVFGQPGAAPPWAESPLLRSFGPALDHLAATYSVGMRRRLAFVALTAGESALWVLDEPFAGVDRQGQEAMQQEIARALARGAGVLLSAHDSEETPVARLRAHVQTTPSCRVRCVELEAP
jgi:ABC-type multidrug transport system ATPase subunit